MRDKEKYDLTINKAVGIFSKLVFNQHQPIIEGKTPEEVWSTSQQKLSTSCLIHNATRNKLVDFKDIHEYTSSYQAVFDKVVGFLIDNSHYTHKSTEMYF